MKIEATPETLQLIASRFGITIESSSPRGEVEPAQSKDSKPWPHIAYDVTLKRNGRDIWKGPYKLGVGHVKGFRQGQLSMLEFQRIAASLAKIQKVAPKLPDVLHSLMMDGSPYFQGASFEEWAGDYGYDTDSRSAEKTYAACMDTGRQMSRAFTAEELAQLQEAAREY
jgi:hypothetical protein